MKGWCTVPDSLCPSSNTRTIRRFFSRCFSARIASSMAALTRAASASRARRTACSSSVSSSGGKNAVSNGSLAEEATTPEERAGIVVVGEKERLIVEGVLMWAEKQVGRVRSVNM
jgi:hypothetical protein